MKLKFKSEEQETEHYIELIKRYRGITIQDPFNYYWNYTNSDIDDLYRNGVDILSMFNDVVDIPVAHRWVEHSYFVNEVSPWNITLSIQETPFIEMVQVHTEVDRILNDPYYIKKLCNIHRRTRDKDEMYNKWVRAIYEYRKTIHSIKLDELTLDGMDRYMNRIAINYHILKILNSIKNKPTMEDSVDYLISLGLSSKAEFKLRKLFV